MRVIHPLSAIFDAVIAASRFPAKSMRAALDEIGSAKVVECLAEELASRAQLQRLPRVSVPCRLRLRNGNEAIDHDFFLGGDDVWRPAHLDSAPDAMIQQELWEAVRALFGAQQRVEDSTRTIWILNEPGPETDDPNDPWLKRLREATMAANAIVRCFDRPVRDLDLLACHFGSDKWGDHFYTPTYETHFARFRNDEIRVLEIGIGGFADPAAGGESLKVWRHYFPRAKIVGLDIFDKRGLDDMRIVTVRGDQSDREGLARLAAELGPFDIVIDDGSHISEHVIASFETLFPLLAVGGLYVVEDLQTAYWTGWNGGVLELDSSLTATGYLKQLVDALHHIDLNGQILPPTLQQIGENLHAVYFYRNLTICEKRVNRGQAAPSWVRRTENDMDLTPPGSMQRIDREPR